MQRELIEWILFSAEASGASVADVLALADELQPPREEPLEVAAVTAGRARVEFAAGTISLQALEEKTGVYMQLLRETGSEGRAVTAWWFVLLARSFEGDEAATERALAEHVRRLEGISDAMFLAYILGIWAFHQAATGQLDRALETVERGRSVAHSNDIADQVELDLAEAYARALSGDPDQAVALVESARGRAAGVDMSLVLDRIEYVGARVAVALGDTESGRAQLSEQIRRLESLGYQRIADSWRRDLAALDPPGRD